MSIDSIRAKTISNNLTNEDGLNAVFGENNWREIEAGEVIQDCDVYLNSDGFPVLTTGYDNLMSSFFFPHYRSL